MITRKLVSCFPEMNTFENDCWKGLRFLNSQLHTLSTNKSFKQSPQNPPVSMSSRLLILSLSGIGSRRRRRRSMCCPASWTHTADPPVWSLRLWGRSVLLFDSSLCARWLMCNVYAPRQHLSKCHCISRSGLQSSLGRSQFVTIHLRLPIFSGAGSFEAIQTWWLPQGSWGGQHGAETLNGVRCLLAACGSICWSTNSFVCSGHRGRLACKQSSDISPQFPGILS